jgi:hypothetical protein
MIARVRADGALRRAPTRAPSPQNRYSEESEDDVRGDFEDRGAHENSVSRAAGGPVDEASLKTPKRGSGCAVVTPHARITRISRQLGMREINVIDSDCLLTRTKAAEET